MNKSVILLDGGMGQELVRRSGIAPTPLWSTRIMLDNPSLVEELHIDFIKAGAKVIALNNYTATPWRLSRDASIDLFEPIHQSAKEIAASAKQKSGQGGIKIAGCLPPVVASYKPSLVPSEQECLDQYRRLVNIQKDGIDIMLCETLATIREAFTAVKAATEVGLDTVVSFTLDDNNPEALRSGESLSDAIETVIPFGVKAVSVNCSMPETVTAALPLMTKKIPIIGCYANGFQSVALLEVGGTTANLKARQDLTPQLYAQYALEWAKAGVKIIGGCCEVGPSHIAEVRRVLNHAGYEITPFP
ncbi:homocysteine S-methyltransferase family protein [Hellea balneolensis]|uniref:homocysteine S-methyltransferase family protein n=1 Tax=Hellea balneolensis TaxID=287478 RepID=UPI00047C8217|nr:homocysteine S-methyltransferase family protein [Hellea balneolensis]